MVVTVLHLHHSERSDTLVEPLARLLSAPLPDPFALDVVAVAFVLALAWSATRHVSARRFAASARYAISERAPPLLGV